MNYSPRNLVDHIRSAVGQRLSRSTRNGDEMTLPGPRGSGLTSQEQFPLLNEVRERLINIEQKVDNIRDRTGQGSNCAHPDQAFGGSTYAQFGEDLIILNLFHMLGVINPSYLDVGAHHPYNISNTALLHLRGSRGINVDANPNLIGAFREHRGEDINLNVGVGPERGKLDFYFIDDWSGRNTFRREIAEDFVRQYPEFRIQKVMPIPVVTLNDIVTDHANGRFPDLLSLDVEGLDHDILKTASFDKSQPTIICTEAELDAGPHRVGELSDLLGQKGYRLFTRTVSNLIFVQAQAMKRAGYTGGLSTVLGSESPLTV